ncbi:hypothetical protein EST38_g886 [Candolleomyces aberdarensis]|uniref:Uncharacterized protein n=1 Tax=Candolleomyces aberdarensis TaxID=2316362 RepID=A0A4Q2DWY1_9AGAR|nr:hypothetical protein EST38_g886 [Candolleomyces aberdarensis]
MTPEVPYGNRHPDYYSEWGNLTIQVMETYFKISDIKFWTHSQFFKIVAKENGTTVKDFEDEKAQRPTNAEARMWKLKDVEVNDFERLLWILYPPDHGKCRAKTSKDWEAILKLADRWKFRDVCNLAIQKLASFPLQPIKKIEIMHRHHIRKEWVFDALVTLVEQDRFPAIEDTTTLGLEMTTQLARAREEARGLLLPWNRIRLGSLKDVICREFGLTGGLEEPASGWLAP